MEIVNDLFCRSLIAESAIAVSTMCQELIFITTYKLQLFLFCSTKVTLKPSCTHFISTLKNKVLVKKIIIKKNYFFVTTASNEIMFTQQTPLILNNFISVA